MTTFIEVISVLNILHLRMRRRKLPYDIDDFDMGPSVAQPAPTLQIWTTSDHFYGNYGHYKAHNGLTLKTSKKHCFLPVFCT